MTLTLKQTDSCGHKCGCYFLTINQGLRESRLSYCMFPTERKAEGGRRRDRQTRCGSERPAQAREARGLSGGG